MTYSVKFQNVLIDVNHNDSEAYKLRAGFKFSQYKDFASFLSFLNANSEFLGKPNKTGLILLADD